MCSTGALHEIRRRKKRFMNVEEIVSWKNEFSPMNLVE